MKPFGSGLTHVQFSYNRLTALEGDLFKFNPNLQWATFSDNPFKYIDPRLFESLKQMKSIRSADFMSGNCVRSICQVAFGCYVSTYNFNANRCNDNNAKIRYMELIDDRKAAISVRF